MRHGVLPVVSVLRRYSSPACGSVQSPRCINARLAVPVAAQSQRERYDASLLDLLRSFADYRRRNAPNARGPSPTLISPVTFSSTASITLIELLSQFATMMRSPSDVAAIPSG